MKLLAALLSVSFLLLLGRLSGLFRDWLLAHQGGAGTETDIAILLITLPDLLVTMVIGGGFVAAAVPVFQRLSPPDASRLFLQLTAVVGGMFVIVAALVALAAGPLVRLMSPGLGPDAVALATPFFMLTALAIPLAALGGVTQARLVASGRFAFSASATLVFNVSLIVALLVLAGGSLLQAVLVGTLAGAVLRFGLQFAAVTKGWERPAGRGWLIDRAILASFGATAFFSLVLALLPVFSRAFASLDQVGGLSIFTYAFRLAEVPVALVFGALSTVFLPTIAAAAQDGDRERLQATLAAAVRSTTLCAVALAIPGVFFADAYIRLIFGATRLSEGQLHLLGQLTLIGFLFLPARGLLALAASALPGMAVAKKLYLVGGVTIGLLVALAVPLSARFGLHGVMFAFGLSQLGGAVVFLAIAIRRAGAGFAVRLSVRFAKVLLLPAIATSVLCWAGAAATDGGLAALFIGAVSAFLFLMIVIRFDPEANELAGRVRSRLARRRA